MNEIFFQCTTVIIDTLIPNIVHVISWAKNFFSYATWCKVKKLRYNLETIHLANIYLKGDGDCFLIWSFPHWHTKLASKMLLLSINWWFGIVRSYYDYSVFCSPKCATLYWLPTAVSSINMKFQLILQRIIDIFVALIYM